MEVILALVTLSIKKSSDGLSLYIDGWGIYILIIALGLSGIMFLTREEKTDKCYSVCVLSALFSTFTIIGQNYMENSTASALFLMHCIL